MDSATTVRHFHFKLTAVYVVAAVAWIGFSDYFVALVAADAAEMARLQSYKGWLFVLLTGVLLFGMAARHARAVEHARRSLRRERDFSDTILDTVDAVVLVLDEQGRIERCNRACERVIGYPEHALRGRKFRDLLIAPEARETAEADFERLLRTEVVARAEYPWVTRRGERHTVACSGRLLREDGERRHVIVTGIDITRQRAASRALEASERKYHRLLDTANDAIFIADAGSGTILEANRRAGELVGTPPEALIGRPQWELHPPEAVEYYRRMFQQHAMEGRGLSEKVFVRHRDGRNIPVEISASATEVDGTAIVQGIFRDISDRLRTEEQLHKLSRVVEASPNAIVITDAEGDIEYANPKFFETTGYTPEEVIGRNPRILKPEAGSDVDYRELWETITSGGTWYGEFHNRKKNGQLFWWLSTISPIKAADGTITHFVNIAQDIGRLKYAENTVRHLAYYDPLTELPNRSLFREHLQQAMAAAKRHDEALALVFVDLDRFKNVNDTLGHHCGDQLLREMADRLRHVAGENATLARMGGDEFAMVVQGIDGSEDVPFVIESLMEGLEGPFQLEGHELFVTVSVGISVFPEDTDDSETLIGNADLAMFRAKEGGRNNYEFFTEDMNIASFEQLNLEANMRAGLRRDEFEVYYQPKIDLKDGRLSGMEALVRWHHPDLGLVSPGRFIPVAEESGLINALGEWVLRTACLETRVLHEAGYPGLRVSVNLSARQFGRGDLPAKVHAILEETALPPDLLELEITESDVMRNAEEAVATLQRLKAMGIRIAVDDFGTGYSSLSYLKRFPIDVLKVDQSFTRDVTTDPDDAAIAKAVIALARSMRLTVVAEGVETPEHLDFFRDEGCDEVQGYLFSRPVPREEFVALVEDDAWLRQRLEAAPDERQGTRRDRR